MARQVLQRGNFANDHANAESFYSAAGKLNDMTLDLYSLQSQIISAGDARFIALPTTEAKISAARVQAKVELKTIVSIPAVMMPFDASLVDFTEDGIRNVREGGDYSVYDFRAYGASTDLSAYCDASWTAMVAGAITTLDPLVNTRLPRGAIHIPAGYYKFLLSATIQGVQGLQVEGEGANTSVFVFDANLTNGLNLDGVAYTNVQNMGFAVSTGHVVTNLVKCDWSLGIHRGSSGDTFHNLSIGTGNPLGSGAFVNGLAAGIDVVANVPTNAIDGLMFSRVVVHGAWTAGNTTTFQAGIIMGDGASGNCLDHCFYNCEMIACAYGYNFNNANGFVYGGQNENCGTDFRANGLLAPLKISGIRSEGATAFLWFGPSSGSSGNCEAVEIDNIGFAGNALTAATTYPIITFNYSGMFKITNFRIFNVANASALCVVNASPLSPTRGFTMMVDGFVAPNSQTVATTFKSPLGAPYTIDIRGFVSRDNGNSIVATTPWQMFSPAATKTEGMKVTTIQDVTPTLVVAVASQALNVWQGNYQEFNITSDIAVVIQAPTNTPASGSSGALTVTFYNNSGGALSTAPTFATGAGAFLLSAAAVNPANTTGVTYLLRWSPNAAGGARYREISRTVAF